MSRAHQFRFALQGFRFHLFGVPLSTAVLGGAMMCSLATTSLAQAPSDGVRPTSGAIEIWNGNQQVESKVRIIEPGSHQPRTIRQVSGETHPKVVDVSLLAQQKSAAKRWLNEAKQAAIQGDVAKARTLAQKAADIPATWDLSELTPERFLRELHLHDDGLVGSAEHSSSAVDATARYSELPSPPLDTSVSGSRRGSGPSQAPGGWTFSEGVRRIPTHALDMTDEPADPIEVEATAVPRADDSVADAPTVGFGGPAALAQAPVIDVRVHDFNSTADASANQSLSWSSQILINLGSILIAGLVGGLVLVGLLCLLVRKIGRLADIVLKIEVNNRGAGGDVGTLPSNPSLRLARISTLSSDGEVEGAPSQAESLPRKVLDENVDLRGPRQPGEGAAA